MRTYREAKAMAKSLRESLAGRNIALSHGECLEIVARQFGFSQWNVLATKLDIESGGRPAQASSDIVMQPAIPILKISSLAEAKAFYVDRLGFTVDWGDESEYAQLSRSEVTLHLAEHRGVAPRGAVLIRMRGLDAFHGEVVAKGFALPEIHFTPYDSRELTLADPFGNSLRFWENNPPGVAANR